jgi:hypothetical protein
MERSASGFGIEEKGGGGDGVGPVVAGSGEGRRLAGR